MYTRVLIFVTAASMNGRPAIDAHSPTQGALPSTRQSASAPSADVRGLLASARGVAAPLCVLASDGAANWGGGWDAPELSIQGNARTIVRDLRNATPSDA